VVIPTVSTVRGGRGTAVGNGAKVALLRTSRVGAAVLRLPMVEGAYRAGRVVILADRGCMAVSLTIAAASGLVGGVSSLGIPLRREQKDIGAHFLTVLGTSGDNDREGKFK